MTTISLPIVVSAAMMLYTPYCIGQSNVVYYGVNTNALAVTFVDTNLSAAAQASIVSDLQICLTVLEKTANYAYGTRKTLPDIIVIPPNARIIQKTSNSLRML